MSNNKIKEEGFNYGHQWSDEGKFMIASMAFEDGAKSEASREYHQRGMYSEEEVKTLIGDAVRFYIDYAHLPFAEWWNNNKKK